MELFFLEEFFEVGEAVDGNVVTFWLHLTPNGRSTSDHFDVSGEGLDDNVTGVVDFFERFDDVFPIDVVATWCATIATAGMEVTEVGSCFAERGSLIFFLDVHVEGIKVKFDSFGSDSFDQLETLVAGVEEVGFETVERLDAKKDAFFFSILCDRLEVFHHEIELRFFLFVAVGTDETNHGIDRADDRVCAENHSLVDERFDVVGSCFLINSGATEVAAWAHAGAKGADGDSGFVSGCADFCRINVGWILNREFQGLKAPLFEFGEKFHAVRYEW